MRRRAGVVLLVGLLMSVASARAQDETEQPAQPPLSPTEQVIELNRGIQAFLEADFERASEIFERVLAQHPGHPACLYYLGLIHLDEGLRLSSVDSEAAHAKFNLACENLEQIMQQVDPTVAPVEAALLLGIAQLAADVPKADTGLVIELATAAQRTLQSYVETIEAGKNDRYGFFYLGVAQYRLGDYYNLQGNHVQAGASLSAAVSALETAERLAEVDRKREELEPGTPRGLDEAAYQHFKQVVSYYRGLVKLQRRQNREARQLLEYVRSHGTGELSSNAAGILEKLDETEAKSPLPLSFDSPLGRLDLQGSLSVGGVYDTNVILLGGDTILPLGIGQKHDFRLETAADFYVSRYIDKTEAPIGESLSIGLGGGTAHGWHPDIREFDVNSYAGRAFVQWQPLRDWYFGTEYEYAYTKLGTQPYISGNRLTPVLSHIWRSGENGDELGRTDAWYNYEYRNYMPLLGEPRFDRDGKYHAIGVRHTFNLKRAADLWASYYADRQQERRFLGNRWLNLSLGYVYRDERTRGDEFDLAGHSILAGVELPLPYRFALEFDSVLTWEDYNSPSLFDYRGNERSDFAQQYALGLTHTFVARGENAALPSLEIKLSAEISVTNRNSNIWDRLSQDVYEYDRAIYGLRLSVDF
jgi:hypothetical protein